MTRVWTAGLITALTTTWLSVNQATAENLVGVAEAGPLQAIIGIDSEAPALPTRLMFLKGITRGQKVVAIDVRPATGQLYGIGVSGSEVQLYSFDDTGRATKVGPLYTSLANSGTSTFGFDFNPVIDRVRLVSTEGQNLVFHPDTGAVTAATNLFYGPSDSNVGADPAVGAIAYDSNVNGTSVTQQRGIDLDLDVLVTVANNAGTLGTIGSLGINAVSSGGFDVSGDTGIGYAVLQRKNARAAQLFQINLGSGAANAIGTPLLGVVTIKGLTVIPSSN
ncbi:DUF4394 domain-containing protein [bacterium]|nr:DUF4394 domain-containing protein [bacterium]